MTGDRQVIGEVGISRSEADISRTETAFTAFVLNKTQITIHKAQFFVY